jgi:glycosyltransferase involved in cell wall biosynthesis
MINPDTLKNPIRVSVIIPALNVEKYLPKCLDSLYQQTLRPEEFEIIIIDDNSSDETLKIAKNFKKKRNNVTVLHNQKNLGPGLSRNKGLDIAKGDYIYFVDGDDYIDPITLEQLLIVAYCNEADIVSAGFRRVDTKGKILFGKSEKDQFSSDRIQLIRNLLEFQIHHIVWNKLIKKDLFVKKKIKFPPGLHEDVMVVRKLFFAASNIVYKPDFYYYWVKREGSITNSITKSHIDDFLKGTVWVKDYIYEEVSRGLFRYVRDSVDIGIRVVIKILVKRIANYEKENDMKKFILYKYLLDKINANEYIKESIFNEKNHKDISYEFVKILSNKDIDWKTAIAKVDYILLPPEMKKERETNTLELKNEKKTFKVRIVKFIRKFPRIYRLLDLIRCVLTHSGGVKGKYDYLIDRMVKYLYNRRFNNRKKRQAKQSNKQPRTIEEKIKEDVLFFCDCDYHIRNAGIVARNLSKVGISTGIVDMTKKLNQGKRQLEKKEKEEYSDLNFYEFNDKTYQDIDISYLKLALFFNDTGIHNSYIRKCRFNNVITVGIDEGVNDFLKLSEGFLSRLSPYRTPEHVFLPGKFETQFFKDRPGQYHIVGLPIIRKLYKEEPTFPKKPVVAINVNFSYGVLTNCRENYVKTAIEGCRLAGVEYVITQHPMDDGILSDYNLSEKNMYDTIRDCSVYVSRFSGSIIEALAMGKPCVYHNPHKEEVLKFQKPMGAYSISDSAESLAKAIKYELDRSSKTPVREYSRKFMEYHANIGEKKEPEELITETIIKLTKS